MNAKPDSKGRLKLVLMFAGMLAFAAGKSASAAPAVIDLNGVWEVSIAGANDWIPATVPGCIHTDLLAAKKIPDPFYRDNELAVQWIGETNWVYRRRFSVPAEFLQHDRVLLRCAGLDTLATVRVNGRELGRADNMFRVWEFDAQDALKPGDNEIEIAFASPLPLMRERQSQRTLYEWSGPHEPTGRAWVRKEPCNFGWDWGPVLITCGIWRDIGFEAFDTARFADVAITQDHSQPGSVGLHFQITPQKFRDVPLTAWVSVHHRNLGYKSPVGFGYDRKGRTSIGISRPELWWPRGLGAQPLYDVDVELFDTKGHLLDRITRRIGLRTVKLLPATDEQSLRFEVNGVPFFAKGANWIPADAFPNRVAPEKLRRCVADAAAVNMNVLRFWGGSYYEEDALFDACDELGICVWLDCKFACSSYPAFDDAFMANVREEISDNVRRLRDHPSIAVWCGNNEISLMTKPEWSTNSMGRADYDKLFRDLIGGEVRALAPQANYVPGSPEVGDVHYWQVWHGGKPFSAYRTLNGFMSEFGFQSFPEPKTVRAYTTDADRASLATPVMDWHQRSAGDGNKKIRDMTDRTFRAPKDFDSALWLSQLVQANGIKTGAEFWRQNMPKSMGCVFWQYNDCWPVASWSSVDYFGRWKALHYFARRFYAPLLVSGLENVTNRTVDVFVTSDRLQPRRGTVSWTATDPDGRMLARDAMSVDIAPQKSRLVKTLDLREPLQQRGASNVLVWLKLTVKGETVSDNLISFTPPKELNLADPQLKTSVARAGDEFVVTVQSRKPALWVWLNSEEFDARYSDNFVHVPPGAALRIRVRPDRPLTLAEFQQRLRVRSLFDTYH